jgi:hemolysin activation/secretion protein
MERPPAPKSTDKILVREPSVASSPEDAGSVKFILSNVEITGSSIYSESDLSGLYSSLLGQEVTLETIFAIANAITQKYASDGYALSIGYVPAQEISNGQIRIGVAEGYVGDIDYQGEKYPNALLASYAAEVLTSRPLTTADLERFLLLANDIPGVSVESTFTRSEGPSGSTRLVLEVSQDSFGGAFGLSNRGSKALGQGQGFVHLEANSPFGSGEQFSLDYVQAWDTREMAYVGVGFVKPVGRYGTSIGARAGVSQAEPGTELLETLEFLSEGASGAVYVNHPFVRSRKKNVFGRAELAIKNFSSEILGELNSDDKLRVLRIGADVDWLDSAGGVNLVSLTASRGLDILGASKDTSLVKAKADGNYDFTKANVRLYRLQDFGGAIDGAFSIDGQYALETLPASEGCGYGGSQYGRGFDGFQLAGDHCLKASAEIRWHIKDGPKVFNGLQLYGFGDWGKVWKEGEPLPGEYAEKDATSAGLGVRFGLGKKASMTIEYAHPFEEEVGLEGNKNGRVFASLGVGF